MATGLCVLAAYPSLVRTELGGSKIAVTFAIMIGVLALAWRIVRGPASATVIAALAGLAYVAKPFVAPIAYASVGQVHGFSPSSETHLYFVIPGLGLGLLAVIFVMTTKLDKAAAIASVGVVSTKLDPPRPAPPRPDPPQP